MRDLVAAWLGSFVSLLSVGCASVVTTHSASPVDDERGEVRMFAVGTDRGAVPLAGIRGGYRFPVGERMDVGFGVGTHGVDADLNLALIETAHFAASLNPSLSQGLWLWRDGIHAFTRARLAVAADVVKVADWKVTLAGGTGAVGVAVSERPGPTARGIYFEGMNGALNVEAPLGDGLYLVGGIDGTVSMGRRIEPLTAGAAAWTPHRYKWVGNVGIEGTFGE